MKKTLASILVLAAVAAAVALALSQRGQAVNAREQDRIADADRQCRQAWGKGLDDLPEVKLIAISPHNRDIEFEFELAFNLRHAVEHGQRVRIEWRSVSGGGSAIVNYLTNLYHQENVASSGIDVVWGGGDYNFVKLARTGPTGQPPVLQPMTLRPDVLANVPETLGGSTLIDPDRLWIGAALSGFGILYNRTFLDWVDRPAPHTWDDLADGRYRGLLALADPSQSGSAAATYVLVVQSESDWPAGWAKLHAMLGNTAGIYRGAGDAANAVVTEAPVATAIDFYGFMRVENYPEHLVYTPPEGQAIFTCDPIGICRNPPHPELAQRFVDFVMSADGQALWALRLGTPGGPVRNDLLRTPIRRDVFETRGADFSHSITNPYTTKSAQDQTYISGAFGVIPTLVRVGPLDNLSLLKAARQRIVDGGADPRLVAIYNELPENLRTAADVKTVSKQLRDRTAADRITTDWRDFFRRKYLRILDESGNAR